MEAKAQVLACAMISYYLHGTDGVRQQLPVSKNPQPRTRLWKMPSTLLSCIWRQLSLQAMTMRNQGCGASASNFYFALKRSRNQLNGFRRRAKRFSSRKGLFPSAKRSFYWKAQDFMASYFHNGSQILNIRSLLRIPVLQSTRTVSTILCTEAKLTQQ